MDLGKPKNGNVIQFHARNAKESMPTGAAQKKKANRNTLWRKKRDSTKKPIVFNIFGPCSGRLEDVMDLGIRIAQEALGKGDKERAERIVTRVKKIPMEYERERLMKMLKCL